MNGSSRESKAEAKRLLKLKIEAKRDEPTKSELAEEKRRLATVSDVYEIWRQIKKMELKETTYFSQGQIFKTLLKEIRYEPISSITVQDIQKIIFAKERTISTKRNYKGYLQQFFDYAVDLEYISENPVKRVKLPKRKISVEDVKKSKNRYLDINDLRKLIDFVEEGKMNSSNNVKHYEDNQKRYLYAYIFMFSTGLRIGELQALRYKNIEGNVAHIDSSLNRKLHKENERVLTTPKTVDSYRDIILNKQALEVLDYFKSNRTDDDFVFVDDRGQIMVYKTLQSNFSRLCEKALGERKTLHMLRHGFVSLAHELGVPEKAIMAQVGHAKNDMTLHYTHLTQKMSEEMSRTLNEMNFNL